jgi:Concanavalin A-like lectin/glucanases superfamily
MAARSRRVYLLAAALMVGVLMAFSGSALGATQTVALWKMEDPSQLIDDSGNNNNGTTSNITSVQGVDGNGYHFDGASSIATVPASDTLNPGSADITITAHVNFTQVPNATVGDYDLIRKGLATSRGGDYKMEIVPKKSYTVAKALCIFKDSAKTTGKVVNGPNLADGAWHTISCTKTPTSVVLTVDGKTYTKAVQLGSISNSDVVTIGAQSRSADWYAGDMDEVSVDIG